MKALIIVTCLTVILTCIVVLNRPTITTQTVQKTITKVVQAPTAPSTIEYTVSSNVIGAIVMSIVLLLVGTGSFYAYHKSKSTKLTL
jgi:hypothetical protein